MQRLLDGELPAPALSSAEEHVAVCPSCLEAVREAKCEEALISSFFAPQPFAAVPTAKLWGAIRAAVSAGGQTTRYK